MADYTHPKSQIVVVIKDDAVDFLYWKVSGLRCEPCKILAKVGWGKIGIIEQLERTHAPIAFPGLVGLLCGRSARSRNLHEPKKLQRIRPGFGNATS